MRPQHFCFHLYLIASKEHFICESFSANPLHVDIQKRTGFAINRIKEALAKKETHVGL